MSFDILKSAGFPITNNTRNSYLINLDAKGDFTKRKVYIPDKKTVSKRYTAGRKRCMTSILIKRGKKKFIIVELLQVILLLQYLHGSL